MDRYEYVRIPINLIPDEIIQQYDLTSLQDHNGWVYMEVRKGMYGLPQAGILANDLLSQRLKEHGYYQMRHTDSLWSHTSRPITFSLVVDDFGVKYTNKADVLHLKSVLENHYPVSTDWTGSVYCGLNL